VQLIIINAKLPEKSAEEYVVEVTSILKKLQLKEQNPILIINSPDEYETVINSIQAEVHQQPQQNYSFVQIFVKSISEANKIIPNSASKLEGDGKLWICYPKQSSKNYNSDISRDKGWNALAKLNFEPVTMISIDQDWSGLRFRKVKHIKTMIRKSAISKEGKARILSKQKDD
jgi:hypothetical protein